MLFTFLVMNFALDTKGCQILHKYLMTRCV